MKSSEEGNISIQPQGATRHSFHVALPLQSLVQACDCKPETLETLVSLLGQGEGELPLLHVEGISYDRATIALKKRPLARLTEKEPVVSCIQKWGVCIEASVEDGGGGRDRDCAIANPKTEMYGQRSGEVPAPFQKDFLAYSFGSYTFSVTEIANRLGPAAEPRHVFAALRRLPVGLGHLVLRLAAGICEAAIGEGVHARRADVATEVTAVDEEMGLRDHTRIVKVLHLARGDVLKQD